MTAEELTEKVKDAMGILTDDADTNNQLRIKALAVMRYINNGGGAVTLDNASEYEIQCIALGVNDLLNQNGTEFSEGFKAMASQLQLRSDDSDKA